MDLLPIVAVVALAAVVGYLVGRRRAVGATEEATNGEPATGSESDLDGGSDLAPSAPAPTSAPVVEPEHRAADGIERALADLRLGVVVIAPDGSEVYRNNTAAAYGTGRHGDALVDAALERVVAGALLGRTGEERIEIYGPPARSMLVQASPTFDGTDLTGVVGVIDDVTEVSHMLRVRSDFVANVSHELRTPVGAMSVLAETIADADDPEVVDRLSQRMLREASRLADTIEDLLTLSRLESGSVDDPERIDLVSVATLAVERTSEAAAQRSIEVAVGGDGRPVLVDGDHGLLVSAVTNLLDNAIKYSETAATVHVDVSTASGAPEPAHPGIDGTGLEDPHVNVNVNVNGDRDRDGDGTGRRPAPDRSGAWSSGSRFAELTVVDQGIGIPDRDQERIFERFYRVDNGRSRETGGTGLGLSIVRHVLRNHRGTVDVDSTEGRGATFTIRLPLASAEGQPAPVPARGVERSGP